MCLNPIYFSYMFSNYSLCSVFLLSSFPAVAWVHWVFLVFKFVNLLYWLLLLLFFFSSMYFTICSRKNEKFSCRNRRTEKYAIITVKFLCYYEYWLTKIPRSKSLEPVNAILDGKTNFAKVVVKDLVMGRLSWIIPVGP